MNTETARQVQSKWRFEKRGDISPLRQVAAPVIAIAAALLVSSALILAAGANVGVALHRDDSGRVGW